VCLLRGTNWIFKYIMTESNPTTNESIRHQALHSNLSYLSLDRSATSKMNVPTKLHDVTDYKDTQCER
jgi:hypothetical protein